MEISEEEKSKELEEMIALGLLDRDWARGLSEREAQTKIGQILSNDPDPVNVGGKLFENEDMNQEVLDMIALGLLDRNWAEGMNRKEAGLKFNLIISNDHGPVHIEAGPFESEEQNKEVRDMITRGLLDENWARGMNRREAGIKFDEIRSSNSCSTPPETQTFSSKSLRNRGAPVPRKQSLDSQSLSPNARKSKTYKLIPLSPHDQIYKDILADFERCKIERKVKAIQRVENEKREKVFEEETNQLERLHEKESEFFLNIQDLYHGSNAPRNLICSRGLDQRVGQIGIFGRGIYFSDNVRKCENYLTNTKGSAIYKCSVILGDIKEYGEAHPELKQEPEKENGDYYDSVKGNVDGFNQFIIYDNRRSLIKYRIVLEGTEDEDSDIEEVVAEEEQKEKMFEAWKRHMHYLVKTCRHEDEEDSRTEQEIRNIEKIRLEIRRRREITAGGTLTDVNYELLREERKTWKSFISRSGTETTIPPQPDSDDERTHVVTSNQDSSPDIAQEASTDDDTDDDGTQLVFDKTLSEFIEITHCDDLDLAKDIIESQSWNLEGAVNEYFFMMQ